MTGENKDTGKKTRGLTCPFLGFNDDPETAISYPSKYNCCYHARPVRSVSLKQQSEYCLTGEYSSCPIFLKEKLDPLPRKLWGEKVGNSKNKRWVSLAALIGILILGVIAGLLLGVIPSALPGMGVAIETPTFYPTRQIIPTQTMTQSVPTPTKTATPLPTPTATLIPPTEAIPRSLETPLGNNPRLIMHQLMDGEGLNLLAQLYNTSTKAITAVNYNLPQVLWVGTVIVIPLDTEDTSGLPSFIAYQVENDGTTIEELATSKAVSLELLKKYNELPDGYVLTQGEWLLIPQQ